MRLFYLVLPYLLYTSPIPDPAPAIPLFGILSAIGALLNLANEMELLNGVKHFCQRLTGVHVSCVKQVENALESIRETGNDIPFDDYLRLMTAARKSDAVLKHGPFLHSHQVQDEVRVKKLFTDLSFGIKK